MYHTPSRQRAALLVQPIIAELLRTCVHPTTLPLRVEHIIHDCLRDDSDTESDRCSAFVTKLFLTDGELLIQALLHQSLSTVSEIVDLNVGDIVDIRDFVVNKARRRNGRGHVVYLGVERCYVIKAEEQMWNEEAAANASTEAGLLGLKRKGRADVEVGAGDAVGGMGEGFFSDDAQAELVARRPQIKDNKQLEIEDSAVQLKAELGETLVRPKSRGVHHLHTQRATQQEHQTPQKVTQPQETSSLRHSTPAKRKAVSVEVESDDENAFETACVNLNRVKIRRQALHQLSQNVTSSPSRPSTRDSISAKFHESKSEDHKNVIRQSTVRFDLSEHGKQGCGRDDIADSLQHLKSREVMPMVPNQYHHCSNLISPLTNHYSIPSEPLNPFAATNTTTSRPTTPLLPSTPSHHWGVFHNLSSLYNPSLPPKSYIFTTLIIPTHVSSHLISRPNSPFPPKRHIKVIDPSLAAKLNLINSTTNVIGKGITVSVYRDALDFKPVVGKVALMRGVVMQRISAAIKNSGRSGSRDGEVILNVYPEKSRIYRQSQSQSQSCGQTESQIETRVSGQVGDTNLEGYIHTASGESESLVKQSDIDVALNKVEHTIEAPSESSWFIDDLTLLRDQGYDPDTMQNWWDQMVNRKTS